MRGFILGGVVLLAALPATSNYKLNSYGFGSGGTAGSSTATYSLEGISGTNAGASSLTTNYVVRPSYIQTQQANVPKINLDNGGGAYYNKLHFVIDNQNNPTDAKFLIAVSTDNFASNISYLRPDGTLTGTLSATYYQTYSAWGGSTGGQIIGLNPTTTYYVKARATQGQYSESAYGPVASQATASPTLTFNLVTSSQSTPPFSIALGTLVAGNISTSGQTINITFSTNGTSGGDVYVRAQNGGLLSASTGYKINAISADLTGVSDGFGAQNNTVGQTSGGPLSVVSPYNGTGNVVGIVDGSLRSLYTASAPVTGGSGTLLLKAKAATTDVAATDYQEVLTFTAAGNF